MENSIGLYDKTQEQNKELYKVIKPQFRDAAKYIIMKYDLYHSPLDYEDNWSIDKILDFSRVYIEKRGDFLKTITFYLK
jgi:hypothetical protein